MKEIKTFTIKSCDTCPFMVSDIDYNSVGSEVYCYCNLIKNTSPGENTIGIFSDDEFFTDLDLRLSKGKVLEDCPLKENNISLELKTEED